jgi:prepilin-type N-terminal cleavage/methylation domain-containing protein
MMRKTIHRRTRKGIGDHGMTLVEVTLSMVIVTVMLLAALQTVAVSRGTQKSLSDRAHGRQFAMELMNEILDQQYMELNGVAFFGLEPGKSSANRSQFTDVDDYNGWTESPLQDRSGNVLVGTTGWRRRVTVQWADKTSWEPSAADNTGLKLITVSIEKDGRPVGSVQTYRSIAWVDTVPQSTDATSNRSPTASVLASRTTNRSSLTTTLDATGSRDPEADFLSYVWQFGDGTSATGSVVTKTYTTIGTYTATVIVYDGRGGVGSASVVLTVTP